MKTYVLDASALLALLEKKSGAVMVNEFLKEALRNRAQVLMSAANYGEVYSKVLRDRGRDEAQATLTVIHPLPIALQSVTPQRALQAAEVKVKYKLYYVDAIAAALAQEHKATLVTSDSDFRRLGHSFPIAWLKS